MRSPFRVPVPGAVWGDSHSLSPPNRSHRGGKTGCPFVWMCSQTEHSGFLSTALFPVRVVPLEVLFNQDPEGISLDTSHPLVDLGISQHIGVPLCIWNLTFSLGTGEWLGGYPAQSCGARVILALG